MDESAEQIEENFHFYIVDLLAKEYGWTIEYIQNLTLPQVAGLVNTIKKRKENEDILVQLNVAKGMNGKISSNHKGSNLNKEQELHDLEKLARTLGQKVQEVHED
jgi:hypothetical protein